MNVLRRVLGTATFMILLVASTQAAMVGRDGSLDILVGGELILQAQRPDNCDPPEDYKETDAAELGVKFVSENKDERTGFIVAGKNPTSLIRTLREINRRAVTDLEKGMRPGAKADVGSDRGFLGNDEALLTVLAADNAYVVDEVGLTHQELARHLRVVAAIGLRRLTDAQKTKKNLSTQPFTYHGRKFKISLEFFRGDQLSPFRDGTKTATDVTLTNVDSGKVLKYSLLVPDMIERYGFYEGTGTPYRVAPRDILAVLDFLKLNNKAR